MHPLTIASAILAASSSLLGVAAEPQTAKIYIQPLGSNTPPAPLAEVTYDLSSGGGGTPETEAEVTSYEAPELPESATLVRIGLYHPGRKEWVGATSAAGVENFGKGYAPHFLLNVEDVNDGEESTQPRVLGTAMRGVRIDAGQTRDFGPQAKVLVGSKGKQPELNRPVVLSPEGKKVEKEEKSFLQKSVAFFLFFFLFTCPASPPPLSPLFTVTGVMVMMMMVLGANSLLQVLVDGRYCGLTCCGRWWRRGQIEKASQQVNVNAHGCMHTILPEYGISAP